MSAAISRFEPAIVGPRLQRTRGRSRVGFVFADGKTRLADLLQDGAAKIRIPHQPVGDPPQAVLINTAGGLTGGDVMELGASAGPGTRATVTTQAAEKVYRSLAGVARVDMRLSVATGATLAYLPQEAILFDGAGIARRLEADLAGDATLIAIESVILGRTAMGERVSRGSFHDRWRIRRDGKLIFADDIGLDLARDPARPAALDGRLAMATILHTGPQSEALHGAVLACFPTEESAAAQCGANEIGVSAWGGKLVARIAATDGLALRRAVIPILHVLADSHPLPKLWNI